MNTKQFFLAALFCLISGIAHADENPFSDDAVPAILNTPDHLVPVNPYPPDWHVAYTKQLKKHLDLDAVYLARMIVSPSFEGEYSMRVHGDAKGHVFEDSKEFFVTCRVIDGNLWYSMPENNFEKIQKPIKVRTFKAPLPIRTARRVCGLWDEMIFRTHYTRGECGGLDGTTFEFASPVGHGEVWSPDDGTPPALLRDLGEALINYCKAPADGRKPLLDAIEASAAKLEARLKQTAAGVAQPAPAPKAKPEEAGKAGPDLNLR